MIDEEIKAKKEMLDWLISEMDNPILTEGPILELSQSLDVLICIYQKDNSLTGWDK